TSQPQTSLRAKGEAIQEPYGKARVCDSVASHSLLAKAGGLPRGYAARNDTGIGHRGHYHLARSIHLEAPPQGEQGQR
ncbi:MAG: hypothetical protein ACSLFB_01560, partial [Acidimicrobiales bacterium]